MLSRAGPVIKSVEDCAHERASQDSNRCSFSLSFLLLCPCFNMFQSEALVQLPVRKAAVTVLQSFFLRATHGTVHAAIGCQGRLGCSSLPCCFSWHTGIHIDVPAPAAML